MREGYMKRTGAILCGFGILLGNPLFSAAGDDAAKPPCCVKTNAIEKAAAYADTSVYQVDSIWTNDEGKEMKLGALQGKTQVLTMFFASCEYACPALVHDMRKMEEALPPEVRKQVHFTLVSFDSERDTPAALHAYRQRMGLDAADWTLLRGKPDDVLELAALLGVKFKKDARGQFAHSNMITILNPQGEISYQHLGINQDIQPAVEAITKAVSAGRKVAEAHTHSGH
jgi:protein SCO1/2